MTSGSVERSLAAAQSWLLAQDAPEAVIAAHEASPHEGSSGDAPDPADARRWVRRILDAQGPDGAWGGELVRTAEMLLTLREIRDAAGLREQDPGIGRALHWLRARRGVAGAWTDGCSPDRHRVGLCHHFAGGFFSPAPPEVPQVEAGLRSGVRAVGDGEVRFVASVTALRALLEWVEPGRDAHNHLEGLRRVIALWSDATPSGLSIVSLLAAVRALVASPADEDRALADRGLRVVAGKQRGDGSWVETDPFQALEVFAEADAVGVAPERSRRALWHGARLLVASQKKDGSWGGEEAAPRRALIAARTLRRVDPPAS